MKKQVVLVTGASSGMGKHFVEALLKEDFVVCAAARRLENMEDLKALGAVTFKMDVTNEEDRQAIVDTIEKEYGGVDILINNAGFPLYGALEDIPIDDARYQFEVNLFGLGRMTQLVLPSMRKKGCGRIINISSMGGKMYTPLGSWYHSTKHALEGFSDCLRLELSPFGIDVVIIEPGIIKTEFDDVLMGPLLKYSGNGPYGKLAKAIASATEETYAKGKASKPEVVTALILKAVKAKKPKTRYVAGKYARLLMFIRKWFGDRIFDKIIALQLPKH